MKFCLIIFLFSYVQAYYFNNNFLSVSETREEPNTGNYNFEYNENHDDVLNFHRESRQGNKVIGEYGMKLPDGRTRIVKYIADENGYRTIIGSNEHDLLDADKTAKLNEIKSQSQNENNNQLTTENWGISKNQWYDFDNAMFGQKIPKHHYKEQGKYISDLRKPERQKIFYQPNQSKQNIGNTQKVLAENLENQQLFEQQIAKLNQIELIKQKQNNEKKNNFIRHDSEKYVAPLPYDHNWSNNLNSQKNREIEDAPRRWNENQRLIQEQEAARRFALEVQHQLNLQEQIRQQQLILQQRLWQKKQSKKNQQQVDKNLSKTNQKENNQKINLQQNWIKQQKQKEQEKYGQQLIQQQLIQQQLLQQKFLQEQKEKQKKLLKQQAEQHRQKLLEEQGKQELKRKHELEELQKLQQIYQIQQLDQLQQRREQETKERKYLKEENKKLEEKKQITENKQNFGTNSIKKPVEKTKSNYVNFVKDDLVIKSPISQLKSKSNSLLKDLNKFGKRKGANVRVRIVEKSDAKKSNLKTNPSKNVKTSNAQKEELKELTEKDSQTNLTSLQQETTTIKLNTTSDAIINLAPTTSIPITSVPTLIQTTTLSSNSNIVPISLNETSTSISLENISTTIKT